MPLSSPVPDGERSRRTELLAATASNALPIVVVALDWSAAALLLLYWLELGVDSFWAFVRAVFDRESDRSTQLVPGSDGLFP